MFISATIHVFMYITYRVDSELLKSQLVKTHDQNSK